jgi:hypothetical protein
MDEIYSAGDSLLMVSPAEYLKIRVFRLGVVKTIFSFDGEIHRMYCRSWRD